MTDNKEFEHDIFLSYNRADEEWTEKLARRLEQETHEGRKLKVFFAPWDIRPGQYFPKEIENGLDASRKVGLIMSPEAMSSGWVELERIVITYISIEERNDRLIPLYLRTCERPKLLLPILYIDFRDDSKFEESYSKLLAVILDKPLPRGRDSRTDSVAPLSVPIPEPSVEFVSRQDEHGKDMLGKIVDEITQRKSGPVALFGDGGKGKTTLAAEAVRELADTYRIVWTSADGREDFSLSTLLDEIASQLGAPELKKELLEPKKEALQAVVSSGLTLIVLDNFETVSDSEQKNCISWLSKSAPCPSLITTRQRIPAVSNIRVDEMTGDEARLFIERLIEQTNDPDIFQGVGLDSISKAAEFNPLIMGWIVGQIDLAQAYDETLSNLSKGKGEAAQRVFDRSFDLAQLTDDGRDTLLALSLFAPSASRVALAEVAGFGVDTDRLNEAVSRVAALRMLKSINTGNRLAVEGLTRDFASARLSKDMRADEFRRRFTQYFLSYSKEHAELTPENHDVLELEKDNLLSAIDVAFGQQDWPTIMNIAALVSIPPNCALHRRGYWSEAIRSGEQALEAARSSQSADWIAFFAHGLAIAYQQRGQLDAARKLYDESLEIYNKRGNQRGIASMLHLIGWIAQDQGDIEEARKLYNESLDINKKLVDQSGIASTLHQLAMLTQGQGDIEEARKLYNESLDISKKLGNLSGIAITLHELGRLAQDQGDIEQARKLYNESLEIKKKLGDQSGIAITLNELARLEQNQGEFDKAYNLYNESLEITKKIGDQRVLAITLFNLGLISEAAEKKEEAARLFREALSIFEKLHSPNVELARRSLARVTD